MVYCKAWGCKNKAGQGVHFHTFPKDPGLLKQWVIKINRADFGIKDVKKSSRLCSDHFLPSDYECSPELMKSFGLKPIPTLNKNAVPSVFAHKPVAVKERRSDAVMKRRKLQVWNVQHVYIHHVLCHDLSVGSLSRSSQTEDQLTASISISLCFNSRPIHVASG